MFDFDDTLVNSLLAGVRLRQQRNQFAENVALQRRNLRLQIEQEQRMREAMEFAQRPLDTGFGFEVDPRTPVRVMQTQIGERLGQQVLDAEGAEANLLRREGIDFGDALTRAEFGNIQNTLPALIASGGQRRMATALDRLRQQQADAQAALLGVLNQPTVSDTSDIPPFQPPEPRGLFDTRLVQLGGTTPREFLSFLPGNLGDLFVGAGQALQNTEGNRLDEITASLGTRIQESLIATGKLLQGRGERAEAAFRETQQRFTGAEPVPAETVQQVIESARGALRMLEPMSLEGRSIALQSSPFIQDRLMDVQKLLTHAQNNPNSGMTQESVQQLADVYRRLSIGTPTPNRFQQILDRHLSRLEEDLELSAEEKRGLDVLQKQVNR